MKMTEKFTPGEWRVIRYKDDPYFDLYDYLVVETVADEPIGIAAMFQRSDINSEANAALIAAAPAMYALLKLMTEPTFMGSMLPQELRGAAEQILKKARGEE